MIVPPSCFTQLLTFAPTNKQDNEKDYYAIAIGWTGHYCQSWHC